MDKHLHIICLNVPYPVDYGGVFDLFYKLPALQNLGVKIYLHCFEYGRGKQDILNKYCEAVYYYPRKKSITALSFKYPFIVSSRNSLTLAERLLNNDYPILMEGVHCTYILNDKRFNKRKCYVRLHNVEYVYYRHLFQFSSSFFKKLYFLWESKILKRYEKSIASKAHYWAVIEKDIEIYEKLGAKNISFIPLFLPFTKIRSEPGKGSFCLYHGDLSVAENEKAAVWLAENVFKNLTIPFVVAGKNPSTFLKELLHSYKQVCLIANPGDREMQDLVLKAHINIIPSYNNTGIKLKLLNALFNGKHCLVNEMTVAGTGLAECCYIADTPESFKLAISTLFEQAFENEDVLLRQNLLYNLFDNEKNAKIMIKQIWG